jgi:(2R)-sulfolactate sulfo-lyase subunit beta
MQKTFWGYRRENGRVGVRNHVIVLPVDDLANAACEAVAHNIKGAMAIPHPYGRLQFGADLDLHFRTLIGTGANPNVAAVVVIGIEDQWTQKVVDGQDDDVVADADAAVLAAVAQEGLLHVGSCSE